MALAQRKSSYIKGLTWSGVYNCGICGFEVDSAHSTVTRIDGVLTRHPLGFSEDHIIPSSKGGTDTLENIQPSHFLCNVFKRDYELDEEKRSEIQERIVGFIENPHLDVAVSLHIDCGICGTRFFVQNAVFLRNTKKYCSTDCQHTASKRRIKVDCKKCGDTFETIQSRIDDGKGKYCSLTCYSSDGDRVMYNCLQCGNDYYVSRKNKRPYLKTRCSTCRSNKNKQPDKSTIKALI